MDFDSGKRGRKYSKLPLPIIFQNVPHGRFIRLRIQTAAAAVHGGDGDCICCGVIEETPVFVVSISISNQRIYDEHIPKMSLQECRWERRLSLHGLHDVR